MVDGLLIVNLVVFAMGFLPPNGREQLFSGVTGFSLFGAGIAHFAHLGGAAGSASS